MDFPLNRLVSKTTANAEVVWWDYILYSLSLCHKIPQLGRYVKTFIFIHSDFWVIQAVVFSLNNLCCKSGMLLCAVLSEGVVKPKSLYPTVSYDSPFSNSLDSPRSFEPLNLWLWHLSLFKLFRHYHLVEHLRSIMDMEKLQRRPRIPPKPNLKDLTLKRPNQRLSVESNKGSRTQERKEKFTIVHHSTQKAELVSGSLVEAGQPLTEATIPLTSRAQRGPTSKPQSHRMAQRNKSSQHQGMRTPSQQTGNRSGWIFTWPNILDQWTWSK